MFVEVKTARVGGTMMPEENLTWHKLRKMQKAVQMYLVARKILEDQKWQMDAISMLLNASGAVSNLKHFENINII